MKTTRRLLLHTKLLYLALVLGFLGFAGSVALADTATATSPTWALTSLIPYVPIIASILSLCQAIVARELTVTTGFWHTPVGHGLLVFFGVIIGGGVSFLANGQWTTQAAIAAATSALSAFAGAWKTTGKDPTATATASPVITKAQAFMPLAFALLFTVAGCKTTFGKCLLGGLPQTLETVIAEVFSIVYQPSTTISDVEAIGTTPDVACVVAAAEQYVAGKLSGAGGTTKPATMSAQTEHALLLLHGYMDKHPATACRPVDIKRVVERPLGRPKLVASL